MERAISPSPSSSLDAGGPSAANPHRSLVAERRASYRLFPIVEPTPPASPVTLQKATLSKAAGSHRRRSSSLDHQHVAKEQHTSTASGHTISWTSALRFRDSNNSSNSSRKASLPDIRPLRPVKASSGEVSAKLQTLPPRPHTAVDRALEGSGDGRSNSVTEQSTLGDCHVPTRLEQDGENIAAAVTGLGVNFPHTPALRPGHRVRSRPNLRIAVSADKLSDERPPPPPPKSPRNAREGSERCQQDRTPERQHATTNTAHVRDDSDPPNTPAVAQQQALVSLSPTLRVREVKVPPVARGRATQKGTPKKMHELLPSDFLEEKPLPPVIGPSLRPPASKYSDPSTRLASSGGAKDVSGGWSGGSVRPPQRQPPPTPTEPRPTDQSSNRLSRMMKLGARSKSTQDFHARPTSPEVRPLASHPVKAEWNDLPTFATRSAQRAVTPDPPTTRFDDADITKPMASRTHVHLTSQTKLSGGAEPATDYMQPEALSKASLALAAARANVAALRNSNASTGSPGSEHRSRSSGSDIGTLSRHPSDGLPRRPTSPGATDPVETLKDLSEQVEALHTRYASLKVERQKISTSIITSLKQQTFTSEAANLILDEQLSLAAVSSSIDICFAKLKSLECRKEDAIAALVARTTQAQKSPTDNISAMIASMALTRKASLAPSTDSGSRFAPTGRSTPDLADSSSTNRLTQPSTRTFSYGSEPESLDYRLSSLSRKHSNGGDSIVYADGIERQTPATIPEDSESPRSQRVSRIHDAASVLDQRTSDVSALSPVLENQARHSWSDAAFQPVNDQLQDEDAQGSSSGTVGATPRDPSPTSERSMSPDELLDERPKRIRVNGSKAAKILGLLDGATTDGKDSPLIRLPDDKKVPVMVSEVEVEFHDSSKLDSLDDTNATLLSVHTKDTEGSMFTADTQASSELQNLEDQLKSFPRPISNPNTLSTRASDIPDGRRDTGGSFLTNGSSAESSCETDEPEPPPPMRPGRGQDVSSAKSRTDMRKRDPSAHTIQVYLEHDDLLDYYNRMRR